MLKVIDAQGRLKTNDLGVSLPLAVTNGGTGLSTTSQGDLLYADASNSLARLAKDTSAVLFLSNQGFSNNPAWSNPAVTSAVSAIGSRVPGLASLDDIYRVDAPLLQGGFGQFNTLSTFQTSPSGEPAESSTGASAATTIDRFGVWRQRTAIAGAGNQVYQSQATATFRCEQDMVIIWRVRPIATGSCRMFMGLHSGTPARNADPGGRYVGLRYDTVAGDTKWTPITKDNTTADVGTGFGPTPTNATDYIFTMKITGGGGTATFYIKNITNDTAITTGSIALRAGLSGTALYMYMYSSYNEGTTQSYETTGFSYRRGALS